MQSFWVFGYGSLMWNPGFSYEKACLCRLYGYHRSFCIYSTHYRGTKENPGLVLGLKQGGSCQGMAFKIAASDAQATYDYLIEREQVNGVYKEKHLNLYLADKSQVRGLAFVADKHHKQYAGQLSFDEMACVIGKAVGIAGNNLDYAQNTLAHLQELGVYDHQLEHLGKTLFKKYHDFSVGK